VPWWLIKTFRCGTIASVPSARDSIESPAGAENEQVTFWPYYYCLPLFLVSKFSYWLASLMFVNMDLIQL
jgi:hypothetical protein